MESVEELPPLEDRHWAEAERLITNGKNTRTVIARMIQRDETQGRWSPPVDEATDLFLRMMEVTGRTLISLRQGRPDCEQRDMITILRDHLAKVRAEASPTPHERTV